MWKTGNNRRNVCGYKLRLGIFQRLRRKRGISEEYTSARGVSCYDAITGTIRRMSSGCFPLENISEIETVPTGKAACFDRGFRRGRLSGYRQATQLSRWFSQDRHMRLYLTGFGTAAWVLEWRPACGGTAGEWDGLPLAHSLVACWCPSRPRQAVIRRSFLRLLHRLPLIQWFVCPRSSSTARINAPTGV